ncbi:hypothetical protein [Plesiomonas shigelloides]|uniref:hypothetical protein n=1 Tax=Plesiomonas shigelloides TaxID=703 RepID=UPI00057B0581|nr:hypothetical protein [Plesiomonas shigelloides]
MAAETTGVKTCVPAEELAAVTSPFASVFVTAKTQWTNLMTIDQNLALVCLAPKSKNPAEAGLSPAVTDQSYSKRTNQ